MDESRKPTFYPLPGGQPGMMDQATKEFLESKQDNPTQKKLDGMLAEVDRVDIRDIEGKVVSSVKDPVRVKQFRDTLKISEDPETFGHCMCFGDPQIYLYAGKEKVAHLSCQHGFAIRWNDGWKWDAHLLDGPLLTNWLAANGAPQLKREVMEAVIRQEEDAKAAKRWDAAIPKCLDEFKKELFGGAGWSVFTPDNATTGNTKPVSRHAKYWTRLEKAYPNRNEMVRSLLNWFGSGLGPWSGYPSYESIPEELLIELRTSEVIAAIELHPLSEQQKEGAARYFASHAFRTQKGKDLNLVPKEMKTDFMAHTVKRGNADNIERARGAYSTTWF